MLIAVPSEVVIQLNTDGDMEHIYYSGNILYSLWSMDRKPYMLVLCFKAAVTFDPYISNKTYHMETYSIWVESYYMRK